MDWIPFPPGLKVHARRRLYGFAPGWESHSHHPVPFSCQPPGWAHCYREQYGIGCGIKRKTPNGFGGLDPWRWAILETVRLNRKGKNLPFPRSRKPTKNIGGLCPYDFRCSNGCHTVSKSDPTPPPVPGQPPGNKKH